MDNINHWTVGEVISASRLNAMVDAINELLSNNSIDNSNYITVDRLEKILAGYSDTGHTHDISEIANAIIPTKMSQLTNDANYAKVNQIPQQPNFNFKINMIESGKTPSVAVSGSYPNLIYTFNIPMSVVNTEPDVSQPIERMWIGYLPYDPNGVVGIDSLDVIGAGLTKKYVDGAVQGGTLKEVEVSTMGKTSIGLVPESAYACCIYPSSKTFTVTIDNGLGGKETFNAKHGDYPVNGLPLNELIDNVQYKVSGFLSSMEGERFFYID